MPFDVVMPQLGLTMTEGAVTRWLKKPGDSVEKGEPLFEVQTDKVDMEVESQDAGYLEVVLEEEVTTAVGTVIARLWESADRVRPVQPQTHAAAVPVAPSNGQPVAVSLGGPEKTPERARNTLPATPRARALARNLNVQISQVSPPDGATRIIAADVSAFHDTWKPAPKPATKPASRNRRVIAARMEESFRSVPHFYLHAEADATRLSEIRTELLSAVGRVFDARPAYNDLLIKALGLAVAAHPIVNSAWNGGEIIESSDVHVALAVQADQRLYTPVLRNVDQTPLVEVVRTRARLVEACRNGTIQVGDMENASITLSNLGSYGVDRFEAIISPPQSAILAAGSIAYRPRVVDRQVVARLTLPLSLSVDHRIMDGVAAAAFLKTYIELIENPARLLL